MAKQPSNGTLTGTFRKIGDTKNTYKYEEIDDEGDKNLNPVVGSLYIRKAAMGKTPMEKLTITITKIE